MDTIPRQSCSRPSPAPAQKLLVDPSGMTRLAKAAEECGAVHGAELEIFCKDGSKKWVRVNLRVIRDLSGKVILREGTVEDITEHKAAQERMKFLAYYDALTGLPHRSHLQDRLDVAIAGARRKGEKIALLFIDLDRFKNINDSFGHSFGDIVLKDVAKRLRGCLEESNLVARLGGDEFLIMLCNLRDPADAASCSKPGDRRHEDDFQHPGAIAQRRLQRWDQHIPRAWRRRGNPDTECRCGHVFRQSERARQREVLYR